MTARLQSGHPRLDQILHGGLPANAINLIIGAPGSGKTILSQQYVFHNASVERPAVYLSTVSEPFDKILRYAETLEFFDPTKRWGSRSTTTTWGPPWLPMAWKEPGRRSTES